ncbi:MAG: phosphate ABC transporter substrate-binding protein [Candidatus Scalindua sp. AMX11]|nr:MAG: phosphate ABC transporter substrate-binding protein [Candidatus Scalindua sp.]NOG83239.1 phosphate ABC transporter substrate-binding protein [Planctomycetota bacterium]RZV77610.1 MAG: phosphate ABC transporter substrate-binding protein [Candidatus Scalindua sp. SCAELEC01]TDE63517.1 MAG: phosphate ABC transporter substrate-binding protein [Candidatus Scalindua sp. AMX11]
MRAFLVMTCFGLCLIGLSFTSDADDVAVYLKHYNKVRGVSGNLNSMGSDTMNNLMTFWAEGFNRLYPSVRVQIEGKGSSTAPPALISGTVQIGPMSRAMKSTEVDKFENKFGYKPTQIRTALDTLAVYVNKDNPIAGLNFPQVDALFSKTRKGGYKKDITTWGQLGLRDDLAKRPVSLYGRNSASGTYGYFKEKALFKGDYKSTVKEQPGSASVVQSVTEDRFGIGYSGIGYKTSGVRAVPLAEEGDDYTSAEMKNVLNGSYPLARFLYVYVNKKPGKPLDPLVVEFLKYILSKEGQEVVVKDGYIPLPASVLQEELRKIE